MENVDGQQGGHFSFQVWRVRQASWLIYKADGQGAESKSTSIQLQLKLFPDFPKFGLTESQNTYRTMPNKEYYAPVN